MPTRRYDSSGRQAAARARRELAFAVAAGRFAADGWHSTTVQQICDEAGVSPELAYRSMGGKTGLLLGAVRHAGFGPGTDLRAAVQALDLPSLPDAAARVAALTGLAVRALSGLAPLVPVLAVAADADVDAAAMLADVRRRRRRTARELTSLLVGPDAPEDVLHRAADEVYVLTSAPTFLQFTQELRWSTRRYSDWLAASVLAALTRHGLVA